MPTCQIPKAITLVGALIACLVSTSTLAVGVTPPQWSVAFSREILARDFAPGSVVQSWTKLADGDFVLATYYDYVYSAHTLVLRRVHSDGSVAYTRLASVTNTPTGGDVSDIATAVASDGGVYVEIGMTPGSCALLRITATAGREWEQILDGRCRGVQALADGSVLALSQYSLTRVRADGNPQWRVNNTDGGHYLWAEAFAVDAQGVIWVASGGGNLASVLRFDLQGIRLSADEYLCSTCIANHAVHVDAQPGNPVAVVGAGGRGFLALYAADGSRQLLLDAEPGTDYERVVRDSAGRLYVLASGTRREIRRLDPVSGAVLWAAAADDLVPLEQGVLALRRTVQNGQSTTEARALEPSGSTRWSREVAPGYSRWGRSAAQGSTATLLLHDFQSGTPSCGTAPRLLTLDQGSGATLNVLKPCLMPGSVYARSLDAAADHGALLNLGHRVEALDPNGAARWTYVACPWCLGNEAGDSDIGAAVWTPDQGAWLAEGWVSPQYADAELATLRRVAADGTLLTSVPWDVPNIPVRDAVLLATETNLVVLAASDEGLHWQRADHDGMNIMRRDHALIPDNPDTHIAAAQRTPDGGTVIIARQSMYLICYFSCPPLYHIVLRLAADGTERWRYPLPEIDAKVALRSDGFVVWSYRDPVGVAFLRYLDPQGNPSQAVPFAYQQPHYLHQLAPGPSNQLLLHDNGLTLMDEHAQPLTAQPTQWSNTIWIADSSESGFLVATLTNDGADAQLLQPTTLTTRGRFELNGVSGNDQLSTFGLWSMRGDYLYGTKEKRAEGDVQQQVVGRFAIPAAVPGDLVFGSGFE